MMVPFNNFPKCNLLFSNYVDSFYSSVSISLNERFAPPNGGIHGLFDWLVKNENLYFATWLVRDVLEASYTYDGAINALSTRGLIAPCYFIVSGVQHNEGHLITRGINETLQPLQLNLEEDRWYLLETNYDHWKKPFFLGNNQCLPLMLF